MDIFSALVIIVPLILPIAEAYNINLIHLGIIFLTNLEIGYLTPPVGMNLFVASIRFNKPIIDIYKSAVLFIGLSFISLFLITYIPELSIWFIKKPSIVGQWEITKDDGEIERLILKNGNILLKKEGSMIDVMMNPPSVGSYKISGDKIVFEIDDNKKEYNFEIYNDGKRLLLKDSVLKDNKRKEIFYKNIIIPPLNEVEGRLIGKWEIQTNENQLNETIEFFFNGRALETKVSELGEEETTYRYFIKDQKLTLEKIAEDEVEENNKHLKIEYN